MDGDGDLKDIEQINLCLCVSKPAHLGTIPKHAGMLLILPRSQRLSIIFIFRSCLALGGMLN